MKDQYYFDPVRAGYCMDEYVNDFKFLLIPRDSVKA